MPLFSVIIPTYGRPRFLEEAIGSVTAQTVDDFECLVVDDGSPAPVEAPGDPRMRVIERPVNGGPAAARNAGLAEALGAYVAFLDDDDVYTPDRLQLALDGLQHAPIALCWAPHMGEKPTGRTINGRAGDDVLAGTTPHLDATAVERTISQRFSESYAACSDLDWWVRMADHPVATVPSVGARIRRHDETRSRHSIDARIQNSIRLLEEHADFFAERPAASAFRWKRVGVMARQSGDLATARTAFLRSLRRRPDLKVGAHLARTLGDR
jgi:glycosyltransferase involved in cell wall biosynthesis